MSENNLGLLLSKSGRGREAEPLFAHALQTFGATLDTSHPKIVACVENYAGLLREQGRAAAARELTKKYKG